MVAVLLTGGRTSGHGQQYVVLLVSKYDKPQIDQMIHPENIDVIPGMNKKRSPMKWAIKRREQQTSESGDDGGESSKRVGQIHAYPLYLLRL